MSSAHIGGAVREEGLDVFVLSFPQFMEFKPCSTAEREAWSNVPLMSIANVEHLC